MIIRLFKYSIKNILRNKFLSISSVIVLTLLMFFINVLLVLHDVSNEIIKNINSKLTISLYLNEKYDKTSPEVVDLM
jgi:cell division transport system permease protein